MACAVATEAIKVFKRIIIKYYIVSRYLTNRLLIKKIKVLLSSLLIVFFQVLLDEKLSEKAERLGKVLREELEKLPKDKVTTVRGRGLMYALVIHDSEYYFLVHRYERTIEFSLHYL